MDHDKLYIQVYNQAKLVNITEVTTEDWNIMLGLSRVGRIAFLEGLDEQRRDAFIDADTMLYETVMSTPIATNMIPVDHWGEDLNNLV